MSARTSKRGKTTPDSPLATSLAPPRSAALSAASRILVAAPILVLVLSALVWVTGLSRSGFFADDFFNVTHYYRSSGDLTDLPLNTGKYTINFFWALGTVAFGAGSAVPFLALSTGVLVLGITAWLRAGAGRAWTRTDAWWIAGLFAATGAAFPIVLWSSNIVHSAGFLSLGAGLVAHRRGLGAATRSGALGWSLAGGAAWLLAVVSNPLFVPLLALACWLSWLQVRDLRARHGAGPVAAAAVWAWSIGAPFLWFALVAYPLTTRAAAYSSGGLSFVPDNLAFYIASMAPSWPARTAYVLLLVAAGACSLVAARRKDAFALATLLSGLGIAAIVLMQGTQRSPHYMAMPVLLLLSAFAAAAHRSDVLTALRNRARTAAPAATALAALMTLAVLFGAGAAQRAYFVTSPYGSTLVEVRTQIASLVPEGAATCLRLELPPAVRDRFLADMSGANALLIPPVSASAGFIVSDTDESCPAGTEEHEVVVRSDTRGQYVATKPSDGTRQAAGPAAGTS